MQLIKHRKSVQNFFIISLLFWVIFHDKNHLKNLFFIYQIFIKNHYKIEGNKYSQLELDNLLKFEAPDIS